GGQVRILEASSDNGFGIIGSLSQRVEFGRTLRFGDCYAIKRIAGVSIVQIPLPHPSITKTPVALAPGVAAFGDVPKGQECWRRRTARAIRRRAHPYCWRGASRPCSEPSEPPARWA